MMKFYPKFMLICSMTVFFMLVIYRRIADEFDQFSEIGYEEKNCMFPKLDAWDPTISEYIKHPTRLDCNNIQPFLTFIDDYGILTLNETETKLLRNQNYSDIKCFYRTFDRAPKNDEIAYDKEIELTIPTKLSKDLVEVKCTAKNDRRNHLDDFYFNLHAHPVEKQGKLFKQPSEQSLSVLLMAIDSISFSMFKRNMPMTYEYVTKGMGMVMFESFNKVGDNTLPNMVAAMTGKRLHNEQPGMLSELGLGYGYFKKSSHRLPFIWKLFAKKGYTTVFNEDRPDIGMFGVHVLKQFEKKPFDYYYSTFWKAIQEDFKKRNLSFYTTNCFRNFKNSDIFVDLTKRHVKMLKNYLQFIFSFFVYYSHENDGVMIENADQAYKNFFKDSFENDLFNKTIIIFMGDHGQRFSSMRKTIVGLLEERNPMFGMWFPEWFYKIYPHMQLNLINNSKRLSTSFDIHETLKDVLNANYEGQQRLPGTRGLSLLYPLPVDRTCTAAGIPRQYCLCFKHTPVDVTSDYLQQIAVTFVKHLNNQLKMFDQCLEIKFESVIRAENLDFNENVKSGSRKFESVKNSNQSNRTYNREKSKIRLTIKAQPNDAIFEALFVENVISHTWSIEGNVQRLTAYANTSNCVNDVQLKTLCTCKDSKV